MRVFEVLVKTIILFIFMGVPLHITAIDCGITHLEAAIVFKNELLLWWCLFGVVVFFSDPNHFIKQKNKNGK